VSCNFGLISNLRLQITLLLRGRVIFLSRVWYQTKLHSTQFNYHYIPGVEHIPKWKKPFCQQISTDYIDVALYNITADPYEKTDLKDKYPDIVKKLQERVDFYRKTLVPSAQKPNDPQARKTAKKNGAWSPWT